jgi:molybdopterin-guanine dinucleotide biosynthesis protein A
VRNEHKLLPVRLPLRPASTLCSLNTSSQRRLLTGVLLVGGASTRFGSPKALARLGGETLAERAWRVLGEACDERIAVGKGDLKLPFPVLDEASELRAPIVGVIAGLRAAAHERVVVVPVDCPLVTAGLLRALGEAGAVPQTGPIPGAYDRSDLPELERRLAAGELSLRGVNGTVLEVDERLLANVNTPAELSALEQHLAALDDQRPRLRGHEQSPLPINS